jgi:glycosyltransferase involved in cell wall biosynthesis
LVALSRVLVIAPFEVFPPYWGAAARVHSLVKHLSADHDITLLYVAHRQVDVRPSGDDPLLSAGCVRIARVPSLTRYSQVFNPLLVLRGLLLSCGGRYDYILAETGWSGLHALLLSFVTRVPYVLDEHNVEAVAFARMGRGGGLGVRLLRLYERTVCRFARRILCVSEMDRDLLASEYSIDGSKIVVAPNGVDTERFRPDAETGLETRAVLGVPEGVAVVLFNGKLDYRPNRDAVEIICREIMPRVLDEVPDARFIVVGSNPPLGLSRPGLTFTGTVDSVADYINAANVVICPLRSGGGTRFKILEAIACGKPVVSTALGAEGLIGEETRRHLTCADDWEAFAAEVVKAIREGRDVPPDTSFAERYGWPRVVETLKTEVFA